MDSVSDPDLQPYSLPATRQVWVRDGSLYPPAEESSNDPVSSCARYVLLLNCFCSSETLLHIYISICMCVHTYRYIYVKVEARANLKLLYIL